MRLSDNPLLSVVLPTRDRPRFLPTALECYRHQTYPNTELIVVDTGEHFPADQSAVEAVGGRLLRLPPGTILGSKLNHGVSEARGMFIQKMDDDDWYAPRYIETMLSAFLAGWEDYCRPMIGFVTPFLFFDVARWEVRESFDGNMPGATLLFSRDAWEEAPFRPVGKDEDDLFLRDQVTAGGALLEVSESDIFLAVRHGGAGTHNRGHTWVTQLSGEGVEAYVQRRPIYARGPEALLPEWALAFYRDIREDLQ